LNSKEKIIRTKVARKAGKTAVAPKLKSVGIKKKKDDVKPPKARATGASKKPVVKALKANLKTETTPSTTESSGSPTEAPPVKSEITF
jgi:hypothetical protein